MNRKLIRPNFPENKGKRDFESSSRGDFNEDRRKNVPPFDTYAEIFYYKKQIDSRTEMVIVLRDGEEILGTIEWYDRHALKINRQDLPNLLLLKNNIKYMYKAEERPAPTTKAKKTKG